MLHRHDILFRGLELGVFSVRDVRMCCVDDINRAASTEIENSEGLLIEREEAKVHHESSSRTSGEQLLVLYTSLPDFWWGIELIILRR